MSKRLTKKVERKSKHYEQKDYVLKMARKQLEAEQKAQTNRYKKNILKGNATSEDYNYPKINRVKRKKKVYQGRYSK